MLRCHSFTLISILPIVYRLFLIIFSFLLIALNRENCGDSRSCFRILSFMWLCSPNVVVRARSRTDTFAGTCNMNVRPCERNRRHPTTTILQPGTQSPTLAATDTFLTAL